ncbi:MAG: hypothetical protein ABIF82_12495 [Planctomycetota bacterium]
MATSARAAKGTLWYMGGSNTPKTGGTLVEEVVELSCPEEGYVELDATSHDSTAEEFINGIEQGGAFEATCNYTGATGQDLVDAALGGDATQMYINLPAADDPQLDFMGVVSKRQYLTPLKEKLQVKYTVRVSNGMTVTAQS